MKTTSSIVECPHCAGKSGFQTSIVLKAVRLYGWDGGDVDTERYELKAETNPKCMDCGKSVRSLFAPKL